MAYFTERHSATSLFHRYDSAESAGASGPAALIRTLAVLHLAVRSCCEMLLVREIAQARVRWGDRLSTEELIVSLILLLAAGHGTTTHLLGNGLLAPSRHPEQWKDLASDPILTGNTIKDRAKHAFDLKQKKNKF
jgi:hypothetical protein